MKSRLIGLRDSLSVRSWWRNRARRIALASGRDRSVRDSELLENLEARVLLAVDHPSLPNPFNPSVGTVVTIQSMPGTKADGRGTAGGILQNSSDDDVFRFTMPGMAGTSDFVSVLADTLLGTDNTTPLNSTLDSYVEVYNASGQLIASGANNGVISSVRPTQGPPDNGVPNALRPGVATDGWVGFIGEAGQDYYIRVRSEQGAVAPGRVRTGAYTVRIDAAQQAIAIDDNFDPAADKTNDTFGTGGAADLIEFLQDEAVYRIDVPNNPNFLSLATASAIAEDFTALDTHLSVYDAQGNLIVDDEQAGRLTNAFSTFASQPGATFFIRVRSDELSATQESTGQFHLVLDFGALPIALDPVTRVNETRTDAVLGPSMNTAGTGSRLFQFKSEGNGLAFITIRQSGAPSLMLGALPDPAVHIYDVNGTQIAFNDDFSGTLDAQINIVLTGGETYYILVEGFDRASNGGFTLDIESQHTFNPATPIDDHVNETPQSLINYESATPIIFNDPFQYTDFDGNVVDATWKQQGVGRGRLHDAGDTDLFQFVSPLNMQDTYGGDDGNQGRALYVGGNYATADYIGSASGPHSLNSESVSIWDAGRFYHSGPVAGQPGSIVGDIFAMTEWDLDGGGANVPFLIAGGNFGIVDDMGNVVPTNLAIRVFQAFNPMNPASPRWTWQPLAQTDGPVFALTVGDLIPTELQGVDGAELYIGGRFTNLGNNIAGVAFDGAGLAGINMGNGVTGANSEVRALHIFNPPQPIDPDGDGMQMQPPDAPAGLYIGGKFTTAPGVANANNIVRWGFNPTIADPMPANPTYQGLGRTAYNTGVLGVNAADTVLAISSLPVVPAGQTEAVNTLFVGGSRGANGGFLRSWNAAAALNQAWSGDLAYGGTGPVRAMQQWVLPESAGLGDDPFLLVAGGNDVAQPPDAAPAAGFVQLSNGTAFVPLTVADSAVHALHTFADVEPGFVSASSVLYIGGSFEEITNLAGDLVAANKLAKLDFDRAGDWTAIGAGAGVDGLRMGANAMALPTVFALSSFDDNIGGGEPVMGQPVVWDRMERGSTRVHLRVTPNAEAFIGDITVTVYDSNLNIVYGPNNTLSTQTNTPDAGAFDPARQDQGFLNVSPELAFNQQFTFDLWAGEVYYIAVGGSGTGRYTVELITDAMPPEDMDNGDGVYLGEIDGIIETPDGTIPDAANDTNIVVLDPTRASRAPELSINANGRSRTFQNPTDPNNPAAYHVRVYDADAAGIQRQVFNDLPVLQRVNDTDLFKFRAPASGYAEIRMSTFGIISGYQEQILIPGEDPELTAREKQINSPLDGALRIFNNDFEQIGYNDDNYAVDGYIQNLQVNQFAGDQFNPADRFFRHRDPRVVIPVQAGETYFIQVESGQLNTWLRDPSLVDWRHALGAYEVMVRTTPSSTVDDHSNNSFNGTPLAITSADGNGQATGEIRDVVGQNPNDADLFTYIAPNRGQTFIRVTPTGANSTLRPVVTVFDATTGNIVAQTAAGPGQFAQVSIFPEQGDSFLIAVDGDVGSQGTYRVSVDGPGITDDHASERNWRAATPLPLVPFFGTATATGTIENPNDQDLFKFTSETYETASVSVTSLDPTLDPFVQVFEVSSDLDDSTMGHHNFLRVAFNDDDDSSSNSLATFPTSPGRTYYILVSGVNLGMDRGRYQVQVQVAPTDDHPNFTDFQSQGLATTIPLAFDGLSQTGTGNASGNIEKATDDDMFRFTAPANGEAKIVINTPASSLIPKVNVYDANGNLLGSGMPSGDMAMVTISNLIQNQQYFIQVQPNDPMADAEGEYTVSVMTTPVDDHADAGEFGTATLITLSSGNGLGSSQGVIVPSTDTDLFRFTTLAAGATTIRVTTTGSSLSPTIRIFDSTFTEIFVAPGNGDIAQQALGAGGAGETYYVLVEPKAGATGAQAVGQFQISVQGQIPGGGGPGPDPIDDHADAGEFAAATPIGLDAVNGRGDGTGVINFIGDSDLFRFVPAKTGTASVQVNVPQGGLVDGQLRIFDSTFNEIDFDALGIPGATAASTFNATGGQTYYILVEPTGFSTGSYDVRISSEPLQYVQYYPEGFASRRVDEFVPLVNPNPFPVQYALYARYERGPNDDVPIWTGIVQPNSRSGVTITTRKNFEGALVRRNEPYALELRSDGLLTATFSHYDFNVSVGENFTRETSTDWTFANFTKDPAEFRDFLLFYNPDSSTVANVKVTLYYENGFTTSFNQSVDPRRRSGINFNNDGRAPQEGRFGVKIESDIPIVAAQSSYNLQNGGGDGLLGDISGGSTTGVIAGVSTGGGSTGRIAFLNTGDQPATITVTASYARVDLPDLVRVINVGAGAVFSQTLEQLGLTNSEVAGIRYNSNVPVTVSVMQYQNGDGDSTQAATFAATTFQWGDAFNNPRRAGITYLEDLSLYNPSGVAVDITITFLFNDGTTQSQVVNVGAGDFAFVDIDQSPIILNLPKTSPYSLSVTGATPFVGVFTRYDRFLNGGWSALGSPVGLTNPLDTIV